MFPCLLSYTIVLYCWMSMTRINTLVRPCKYHIMLSYNICKYLCCCFPVIVHLYRIEQSGTIQFKGNTFQNGELSPYFTELSIKLNKYITTGKMSTKLLTNSPKIGIINITTAALMISSVRPATIKQRTSISTHGSR